jgi:hypothetical protein
VSRVGRYDGHARLHTPEREFALIAQEFATLSPMKLELRHTLSLGSSPRIYDAILS